MPIEGYCFDFNFLHKAETRNHFWKNPPDRKFKLEDHKKSGIPKQIQAFNSVGCVRNKEKLYVDGERITDSHRIIENWKNNARS